MIDTVKKSREGIESTVNEQVRTVKALSHAASVLKEAELKKDLPLSKQPVEQYLPLSKQPVEQYLPLKPKSVQD